MRDTHDIESDRAPGCFVLNGSVRMDALAHFYALDLGDPGTDTVSDFIGRTHPRPRDGELIRFGPLEFRILEAVDGDVRTVALRFNARAMALHSREQRRGKHARLPWHWPVAGRQDGPERRRHG